MGEKCEYTFAKLFRMWNYKELAKKIIFLLNDSRSLRYIDNGIIKLTLPEKIEKGEIVSTKFKHWIKNNKTINQK